MRKCLPIAVVCALLIAAAPLAGASAPSAKSRVLTLSELPTGWTASPTTGSGGHVTTSKCFSMLKKAPKGGSRADVSFAANSTLPVFDELLIRSRKAAAIYRAARKDMTKCRSVSFPSNGTTIKGTINAMSFPDVGSASGAYALSFEVSKIRASFDLVLFRVKSFIGLVGLADVGSPNISTVERFVTAAVDKVEGKPVHLTTSTTAPTS